MNRTFVSAILLAGGISKRMRSSTPKQYLTLKHKPIALHSFDIFKKVAEIKEIIVVCEPSYQPLFPGARFALPGDRRQDSVFHGLQNIDSQAELVCIHDAARPLITTDMIGRVLHAGSLYGAATVGMPIKYTIKETQEDNFVKSTLDRTKMWEIQTPQVIKPHLLQEGFKIIREKNLTVTDDVSIVELLGHPVKIVEGSYGNLKITVAEDMFLAERLLDES